MSNKRIKYKPEPYKDFESNGYIGKVKNKHGHYEEKHLFRNAINDEPRVDSMVGITMCMLSHPAFKDLKPRHRLLYVYAKSQYYCMVDREEFNKNYPQYVGQKEYIYLNQKLLSDVFKMYARGSKTEMYHDIAVLVEHGFIQPIKRENNQRTIYKLISEWWNWTPNKKYTLVGNKYEWVEV